MKRKKIDSDALEKQISHYLNQSSYTPLSQTALFKALKLPASQQPLAKQIITELLVKGTIEIQKNKIAPIRQKSKRIQGTFRMNPRGFGFVIPSNAAVDDIFIAKHLTGNAIDGDLVEVAVFPHSKKDKGPEGKILSVIKRGRSHLAGTVRIQDPHGRLWIHVPLLGINKPVLVASSSSLKEGDRVIIQILDWGGQNQPITCEVSHYLGPISDASIDTKAATEEFLIRTAFPEEVIQQAKSYGKTVSKKQLQSRLNWTEKETFTIDPTTAKDFDDALSIEKDGSGRYQLAVHIADVAHYVPHGSALDIEAIQRGNSTYFPGSCIPMLPEELSNNLCSLKPGVIRLCISVLMSFDAQGDLLQYEIQRTYIKSAKRFTYEEAKEVLDGTKKSPYLKSLQHMVELCLLLKKKREERGSVDFALPEVVIQVDKDGMPYGYHIVEYDITHQLVEEFMLKANELVAKHLAEKVDELVFRIHEEPHEESLEDFFSLARTLGFTLPPKPDPRDVQKLFQAAKLTRFHPQLAIAFIRSMKLAYYSPENVGHYGLALEHYCHFTSPIRRYPDLIIQRLLFGEQPKEIDLEEVAESCSEKERISFKAEQSVKTLKKLRLLQAYQTENPQRTYSCTITKVKSFGIYFEVSPLSIEGFIHVSELGNDYFFHDAASNKLIGESSHVHLAVGDSIQCTLTSIDFVLLEAKWELLSSRRSHLKKKKRRR